MRDQRMAPPTARRRPGAPGRSKPACSPAYDATGIGSSRRATYHRSVTTRPAAATRYLTRRQGRAEAAWIAEARHGQVLMVPEAGPGPQSQRPAITTPGIVRFADTVRNRA
jgi:hypothetical protein